MRVLISIFLTLSSFFLSASLRTTELEYYLEKVKKDGSLKEYIDSFPFEKYEIYNVPELGRFYLDDIPDYIKHHLRNGFPYEPYIAKLIKKHGKPKTLILDIGAHIGVHTLTMSKLVGPQGLVIAFEPQLKMFREQYYNLRLNNCEHNVVQLPFAAGSNEGPCEMAVANPRNEGGTPLGKGGNKSYMITVDSLNLENISLIKCDVEFYELEVLKGCFSTIERNKPVIIFEIQGGEDLDHPKPEVKKGMEEVLAFFKKIGYRVERIRLNDFIGFPK